MRPRVRSWCACWAAALAACAPSPRAQRPTPPPAVPAAPVPAPTGLPTRGPAAEPPQGEHRHLRDIRQLTQDGPRNLEAYFSPDGQRLAFQSQRPDGLGYRIMVMDLDGRSPRVVSPPEVSAVCPAWAPDRPRLLFSGGFPGGGEAALDLWEVDLETGHATRLTDQPGEDAQASFSPDGRKLVFTSQRDGDPELYVLDRALAEFTRITHAPGADGAASFSPDGAQVVFRSARAGDGTSDLYRIHPDGSGEARLTELRAHASSPFFHPDGTHVVFSADLAANARTPGRNQDLYLLDLHRGTLERITWADGFDGLPAFSPDGRHLAWTSARQGGALQVFLADWQE